MKYQILDKVINDNTFSIVVRYYVSDESGEIIFERIENFDLEIKNLNMETIQEIINNRGKEIKMLYNVQQQITGLEGTII